MSIFKGLFKRQVSKEEAEFSLIVNRLLNFYNTKLPKNFHHFPEILSVYSLFGGMIIREIPEKLLLSKIEIIPMFSLHIRQPDGTLPILQMMKNENPIEWINKHIIYPFVKEILHLYIKNGIMFEAHAQNLLLEVIDSLLSS